MTVDESIKFLAGKADESLEVARDILKSGHPDFAVSRAYYGMFYAAEAVLITKGLQYAKHSAVISNFNKEFVKAGVFPKEMPRRLEKAFRFRTQGDYGMVPVEEDEAKAVLSGAVEFVEEIETFPKREGYL